MVRGKIMIKNIFRVFISNLVVLITGFINGFVFPKLLSIEDYALYQIFLLYVLYIGIFHFGFPNGLFVKYGGNSLNIDKQQYKSEILFILLFQLILTIAGIMIAMYLNDNILLYAVLCIIPVNIICTYKTLYQAWNQFEKFAFINSFNPIAICLLILIVFLIAGNSDARLAIFPYIIVNFFCCLGMLYFFAKDTKGVKANKVLSSENIVTLQTGFLLMLGGAGGIILGSLDRFFIKGLFTSYEFAMYSFALSMQSMMNVFITAVSQPLYPKMASEQVTSNTYSFLKEILLIFGSLSGCTYFVCSIIVKEFISQYVDSLKIMSIFFAIFPAMAVINCLYVNLYKITGQIKDYLITMMMMIAIACTLDIVAVSIYKNFLSIAFATTVCYYIWLWYSAKHFKKLTFTKRDVFYLAGFFVLFLLTTRFLADISGFIIYSVCIIIWATMIYNSTLKEMYRIINSNLMNKIIDFKNS
jgi:O-antigen/teichoic acid export membrane protein